MKPGADTTPNASQNTSAGNNAQTGDDYLALTISVLTLFASLAGVYFARKKLYK